LLQTREDATRQQGQIRRADVNYLLIEANVCGRKFQRSIAIASFFGVEMCTAPASGPLKNFSFSS
jgi:hypothetical protein